MKIKIYCNYGVLAAEKKEHIYIRSAAQHSNVLG